MTTAQWGALLGSGLLLGIGATMLFSCWSMAIFKSLKALEGR